ncbi:MAG: VWA domain-containing protein [Oscillospiraceae bacterium]|nr:VWA domain-containing protein [Oscillospiraceae bacterium]
MKIKRTLIVLAAMMMPFTMLSGCGSLKNNDMTGEAVPSASAGKGSVAKAAPEKADGAKDTPAADSASKKADTAVKYAAEIAPAESPTLNASIADAGDASFEMDAVRDLTRAADDDIAVKKEAAEIIGERPDDIPPTQLQQQDPAEAFILTAGEWNDNENWGFFTNIVQKNLVHFPAFGLNPTARVSAAVEIGGKPAPNVAVELLWGDKVIWTAQTDRDGNAYLFYDSEQYTTDLFVRALGQTETLTAGSAADDQSDAPAVPESSVKISAEDGEITKHGKTEVMFILDTTGSMGDEIYYLQKDFSAIAEETAGSNVQFSMNFYRDAGDKYVTKCNPFTSDAKEVQSLLNKESAGGGGDTPEAVGQILEETITEGSWSKDANKIAFLIFDAPPHSDRTSVQQVQTAVASAAKQGIHLVPVVASNSDRETELFGRAAAAMTNSNYVFLTDDSGVGGSHLEPIIGDYDVEKLHDIIVRNIKEISET